ncbi:hypothetical protein TNIN_319211 [Trichonephila inaurata madagascariensis]|uniref:Uncharacterized protein n=1 Tax=Trichonephila inaurata madagascariensis TaxID=2747483 RepID=A0A8X6XNW3_9ARAC|nr:hypothetical protein TNIN_319211 [Trichonephila inaurata madagascariensis]
MDIFYSLVLKMSGSTRARLSGDYALRSKIVHSLTTRRAFKAHHTLVKIQFKRWAQKLYSSERLPASFKILSMKNQVKAMVRLAVLLKITMSP